MKRLMIFVVGLVFVFSTVAFAVDKPAAAAKAKEPVAVTEKATAAAPKAAVAEPVAKAVKETKMTATGKVTEISDTMLKIERTIKGKVETVEFTLEKPCAKIVAGDKVKISYVTKDGKNVALKVTKVAAKKSAKKAKKAKKAEEAAPAAAEPVKK
ncbi:MAG: hypothetical protein COX51_08415 [Syntrophobacteraceae bacterium CG23_combo_of_CG06-09_8_20_14_all_50_8]|nr:MAG: hypothetical protein COX51_08415 [Syntrophobacteraceae bacterium CG23_combo_of_CG06-09_8_20_14_all_50_8]